MPRHLPRVPGLEVAARYRPATHVLEVGGDFYDLIDFGANGAAAVIGDVQGHSVQAAALMGQVRIAMHSYARTGAPPGEILARTNQLLLELNSELFCSCLYAHIDVPGQRFLLASAGHLPPIVRTVLTTRRCSTYRPDCCWAWTRRPAFRPSNYPCRPVPCWPLH